MEEPALVPIVALLFAVIASYQVAVGSPHIPLRDRFRVPILILVLSNESLVFGTWLAVHAFSS